MHETLFRLFRYKAWANDRLLTALAELGEESPVSQLAIKALSHSYIDDRIIACHLRGIAPSYASTNLDQMPTLADLSADIRSSDSEYVDYVWRLAPSELAERLDFNFTDGAPASMSREEILMHLITHGVGHRGQVSAVMLLNSITPVRDGFTTFLHEVEPAERRRAA